jgi:hypothetical protein
VPYAEVYRERTLSMMLTTIGGKIRGVVGRFVRDRRGGTAVQAIVLLPIAFAALGIGMRLWETIVIRKSLHTGTYLAARYLGLYPPLSIVSGETGVWADVAREFVYGELGNNPWVDKNSLRGADENGNPLTIVGVNLLDGGYECGMKFEVYASYRMGVLPGDVGLGVLPGFDYLRLEESRIGEVLCK